eukprot:350033-Chlamydomonas_euryale.AAC.3
MNKGGSFSTFIATQSRWCGSTVRATGSGPTRGIVGAAVPNRRRGSSAKVAAGCHLSQLALEFMNDLLSSSADAFPADELQAAAVDKLVCKPGYYRESFCPLMWRR